MTSPKAPSLSTPTARAEAPGALPKTRPGLSGVLSSSPSPAPRSAAPGSFPSPATSPKWPQSAPRGCHGEHPSLLLLLGEELSEQMQNSKTPRIKSLNRGMARETLWISAVPEDYSHPST